MSSRIPSLGGAKSSDTCLELQCWPKLGELGSDMFSMAWAAFSELSPSRERAISMRMVSFAGTLALLFQCDPEGAIAGCNATRGCVSAETRDV